MTIGPPMPSRRLLLSGRFLSRFLASIALSVLVAPLWPRKEWFADLLSLLVDRPVELPQVWNFLVQPHIRKFH